MTEGSPTRPDEPAGAPASVRLSVTLELAGKTATGFELPADALAVLGAGKRPPVRVTIADHSYRTTVGARGGRYLVGVSAEHRAAAGVQAGDRFDVEVALDTEPREVVVPEDLASALAGAPEAARFFDTLSFSQRQWYVLGIEDAKTPETRQRRIAKAIDRLEQGRAQR